MPAVTARTGTYGPYHGLCWDSTCTYDPILEGKGRGDSIKSTVDETVALFLSGAWSYGNMTQGNHVCAFYPSRLWCPVC